jgi:spore maturation protein CgeB
MKITIVGNAGGTNVGASLQRAAERIGITSSVCDARAATRGLRVFSTFSWRLLGHRPLHLGAFSRTVVERCRYERPAILIATGQAPLTGDALAEIGQMGIRRINYSTDDPWNPGSNAHWFSDALRMYDSIFTTRRSNVADFERHGCRDVHYLPFGYDHSLWAGTESAEVPASSAADVFFAGAAEAYRIECIRALVAGGIQVALAGDYWKRTPVPRKSCKGHLNTTELKAWTRSTPVSLCLVRRANRDGHVMRSFEIPAIGACMVAEDTAEHREIFGPDGVAVRYFNSPASAVVVIKELLRDKEARENLARAAHSRIVNTANTYQDRLITILRTAGFQPAAGRQ